jgi:hypothetical protein
MEMKTKLSTLWIVLAVCSSQTFSPSVEIVEGGILDIPGDVKVIMAVGNSNQYSDLNDLFFTNPAYKSNRIANIAAGVLPLFMWWAEVLLCPTISLLAGLSDFVINYCRECVEMASK